MKIAKWNTAIALALSSLIAAEVNAGAAQRPFTSMDSFSRTELSGLNYDFDLLNPFLASTDGKQIFFVTAKGEPGAKIYHYKLLMYDTREISEYLRSKVGPTPQPTLLFETRFNRLTLDWSYYPNNHGIKHLTLTGDPDKLAFIASDESGTHQLFVADIGTRKIEQITSLPTHVTEFVLLEKRNEAIVTTGDYVSQDPHCGDSSYSLLNRPLFSAICLLDGESLRDKFAKERMLYTPLGAVKVYKTEIKAGAHPILLTDKIFLNFGIRPAKAFDQLGPKKKLNNIFSSPNQSRFLIRTVTSNPPPQIRRLAQNSEMMKLVVPGMEVGEYTHISSMNDFYSFFTLIDLETNVATPYMDLPIVPFTSKYAAAWPDPVWINEDEVFIPELFPLEGTSRPPARAGGDAGGRLAAERGTLIRAGADRYVVIDHPAYKDVIGSLEALSTHDPSNEIRQGGSGFARGCEHPAIEADDPAPVGCYIDLPESRLRLFTGESHARVPNIRAKNLADGSETLLLELNPQLKEFGLARFQHFVTTDATGRRVGVAVFLPPDYREGARYPVVVAGTEMTSDLFPFQGPSVITGPFAAQALASSGIIVVHTFVPEGEEAVQWGSRAEDARAINAALRLLDEKQIIDPTRIGMVGFSSTGSLVFDMALHPEYPVEALIVSDAMNASPLGFLKTQHATYPSVKHLDHLHCGAKPWGPSQSEWLRRNPYFNLDKLSSAVLIHQNWSGLGDWLDIIQGLERLKKPVDARVYRSGQHPPVEAGDRLAQETLTVDWFNFWLKGVESDDPAKEEQYRTWRRLRELKRAQPAPTPSNVPLSRMDCETPSSR